MNARSWFGAGQAASIVLGVALLLTMVGAGVTREVPIGKVTGRIVMSENGRPLPEAEIVLRPVREDPTHRNASADSGLPRYRYARSDDDGTFKIDLVTAGKYVVECYGRAHQMEDLPIEVVEGKTVDLNLNLNPREPYADLYASQHVFLPEERLTWDLHGFADTDKVQVELFRLRVDDVLKHGSLYSALAPLARQDGPVSDPARLGVSVLRKEEPILGKDIEGTFRLNLGLDAQPEGLYWVRCTAGPVSRGTYFSVSKFGIVMKRAGRQVVAYATHLKTGVPVPRAKVGYVREGSFVEAASSNGAGVAEFTLPAGLPERSLVVMASSGQSSAFVDFYVNNRDTGKGHIYLYTDRPVYRPGDEVSYKGIARNLVGSEYRIPEPGPVEVVIRDVDENVIARQTLQANANGTFSGKFSTQKESEPGMFRVEATFGNLEGDHGVMVAAYRKPNYSIKVRPEKAHYIRGEKVRMVVECEYYFGGPVGGAKVEANIFKAPSWEWYDPDTDEGYSDDSGYGGEWFGDVEAVTDSSGRAVIEFDTRLEDEGKEVWTDSEFNVTASVADEAGAYFEGRGSVEVSAGEFSLTSSPSHYVVEKGQPFDVVLAAQRPGSNAPESGRRIRIEAGYEFWDGLKTHWKPFANQTLATGSDGKVTVTVTPEKGGDVVIRARSEDGRGNEITSETSVWCTSSTPGYRFEQTDDSFTVRLDKKEYDQGESATLMILSDGSGSTAYVTIEADRIYQTQAVKLDAAAKSVRIGIRPEYAPNVYVSVCYVKNKRLFSRQRRLVVDLGRKTLHAEVKSDSATYAPGDVATYTIRTTDDEGRPVSAETSLSVVDESIYAIRDEDTDLVRAFYPMRYNEVSTSHSFETLYLDGGDKAPPDIEIRRIFKDTAYWNPTIQTDGQGLATVKVKLPDNLTTWRATVQAVDRRTAVGSAVSKAKAKKDLMARLQTPPFYVAGDAQRIAASLTNDSGRRAKVNVELTLEAVETDDSLRQSIELEDGETKAVEWTVSAPEPGEGVLTARAWIDNDTTDGVEARIPIRPRGRTETEAFNGDVAGVSQIHVTVKETADRTTGGVRLGISPNLAAPLFQSLDDLIGFPYGCVEQTMSRFMPAVVVSKAVEQLGLPQPKQASRLPAIAAEGYARLGRMQHYDGSWGWWEYDQGDALMTAYVLEGVYRANLAGYPARGIDVEGALKWGEENLKKELPVESEENPKWRVEHVLEGRIYLAYAVQLHRASPAAAAFLDRLALAKLKAQDLAMAVLGYGRAEGAVGARRAEAVSRLKSKAKVSGNTARWDETSWGVESTARGLQALVAVEPGSELIPMAIRTLMLNRRGSMWSSTRDTSISLTAITDYLKRAQLEFGDAQVTVRVNGKELTQVSMTKASIADAAARVEIPMRLLHRGDNVIEVSKVGPGACYYSAELTQTVVEPRLSAFSNLEGVRVDRTYHRLVQEKLENGRMRLGPSKEALANFEKGELVRVVVKITTDRPMQYLQIEDPVPSSCRVVEREDLDIGEDWSYWWTALVVRDDRISYFARDLDKGTFELSYTMRAEQPGTASALPGSVYEMYEPAKRAWTGATRLEVRR